MKKGERSRGFGERDRAERDAELWRGAEGSRTSGRGGLRGWGWLWSRQLPPEPRREPVAVFGAGRRDVTFRRSRRHLGARCGKRVELIRPGPRRRLQPRTGPAGGGGQETTNGLPHTPAPPPSPHRERPIITVLHRAKPTANIELTPYTADVSQTSTRVWTYSLDLHEALPYAVPLNKKHTESVLCQEDINKSPS